MKTESELFPEICLPTLKAPTQGHIGNMPLLLNETKQVRMKPTEAGRNVLVSHSFHPANQRSPSGTRSGERQATRNVRHLLPICWSIVRCFFEAPIVTSGLFVWLQLTGKKSGLHSSSVSLASSYIRCIHWTMPACGVSGWQRLTVAK